MTKRVLAAVLVANVLGLIGPASAQTSPVSVKIVNFAFKPGTVSISKGNKLLWKNTTSATTHSVTAYKGHWSKDTTLAAGTTTTFTFTTAGTFKYYCKFHAHITQSGACVADPGVPTKMCGTVVVS